MDQSQRAASHGFSQLATSFLACLRLGIPRVPLLRLASVPKELARKQALRNPLPHLILLCLLPVSTEPARMPASNAHTLPDSVKTRCSIQRATGRTKGPVTL